MLERLQRDVLNLKSGGCGFISKERIPDFPLPDKRACMDRLQTAAARFVTMEMMRNTPWQRL